jgi:hypothetical protein
VISNIQTNSNGTISNRRQHTAHADDVLTFGKLATAIAKNTGLVVNKKQNNAHENKQKNS